MSITVVEMPPLELGGELLAADGSRAFRWAADEPDPTNRPTGIRFGTARWDGFKTSDLVLRRDILVDWPDLRLLDELALYGWDGSTAWEGRLHGQPRQTAGGHQINVAFVGWMAHAKDRRFSHIFIDRGHGRWRGPSSKRQLDLISSNWSPGSPEARSDVSTGSASLALSATGAWTAISRPEIEAFYDAGPKNFIGRIRGTWTRGVNVSAADTNWAWDAILASDDVFTASTFDITANLRATGPGTIDFAATTGTRRFASLRLGYGAGPAGADGVKYEIVWTNLRVIGTHDLPLIGTAPLEGVAASDVITWLIESFCPKLNARGVQQTTYPITQLAFHDRTHPYDAMLRANAPHLWGLECWEDRTVHYAPADLTDYDWQVRALAPNVDVALQGDSTEDLVSGLEVQFHNVQTGQTHLLLPADHPELRDESVENPFNRAGYPGEDTITLTHPTTADMALELGRIALAERNQPKAPGTINVRGHIQDRAGNWHPVWKVRAGETIAIVEHPNDRPRMIVETDYSHDSRQLRIAVDSSFKRMDAILDRFGTALAAHNLLS